jgi:hypothetical protein
VWKNVAFINEHFIPLALDGDCARQEMAAIFLKRLKGHFANEMTVATPNARLLAGSLEEGLKKWQALPKKERTQLEDLGRFDPRREPALPEGGLVLAVFARPLVADGAPGRYRIYRNPKAHLAQEPGRDHLWMTAEESKSLLPVQLRPGVSKAVPPKLVDRICRRYLIDLVRIGGEGGPRRREDVVSQELKITVEEKTANRIRLRLAGSTIYRTHGPEHGVPAGQRRDAFQVLGWAEVDRSTGAFVRFDVVAVCETGHFDEIGRKVTPLGIAFTLTPGKQPADRVRPHSLYQDYFAKDGR